MQTGGSQRFGMALSGQLRERPGAPSPSLPPPPPNIMRAAEERLCATAAPSPRVRPSAAMARSRKMAKTRLIGERVEIAVVGSSAKHVR